MELPPVTQKFLADTTEFVAAVDKATEAVAKLADACAGAVLAVDLLGNALDDTAASAEKATRAVEGLITAIAGLHGKTVNIGVDVSGGGLGGAAGAGSAAASAAADAAAVDKLTEAEYRLSAASQLQVETSRALDAADALLASQEERVTAAYADRAAAARALVIANNLEAENSRALAAGTAAVAAAQERAAIASDIAGGAAGFLVTSLGRAAAATDSAGAAANRGWRPWWLFGQNFLTVAHWVVAGTAEFLAVAIPALVALGAGLLVASQGAQNTAIHLQSLYTATEATYSAMHQTVGSVLGLGSALQNAQNAANPGVYAILGSAINAAKGHFADFAGAGLQVVHMFDEFAARVNVDLKGTLGTQLSGFLSGMVRDLQQLGQVLGNFGHALVNAFAAMPGLVHWLLDLAVGASQVALAISRLPAPLLTFAIAMEEVVRWGGLLLSLLARIAGAGKLMASFGATNFITRFGAALLTLVATGGRFIAWIGLVVGRLAGIIPAAEGAGAAMVAFGGEVRVAALEMSPLLATGIVVAVAALAFLVIKLNSVKSATQQWIAASSQAVAKASDLNVLPTIYNQLAQTTTRLSAAQGQLNSQIQSAATHGLGTTYATMRVDATSTGQATQDLANHIISLVGTANTVRSNINLLASTFHVSAAGALALANAAGVNLQQGLQKGSLGAQIAIQQINNLRTGLGAMGAPIGVIGADMQALGIQSQLAASRVGQVNQAFDQMVGTLTGGMSGLAQFESALNSMGHDTVAASVGINGAISSISRSAASMGFTLQGFGPKAQQSWQQFASAVQQGNSVLDTMRIGMAEGVVSWGQYQTAIKATAGQLLPFAAHSKTALAIVSNLAQQAGLPATTSLKTLATQLGVTGNMAKGQLVKGVEQAIIKMSNMSVVARNLSATIAGQLDSAMAGAIVKASGLDNAYLKWANDVKANKGPATLAADLRAIQKATDFVATAQQKATKVMDQASTSADKHVAAVAKVARQVSQEGTVIQHTSQAVLQHDQGLNRAATSTGALGTKTGSTTTAVKNLGTAAGITRTSLGNVNNEMRTQAGLAGTASGKVSQLAGAIQHLGTMAYTAMGQVVGLGRAISNLPTSKTVTINVNTVTTTTHRQHGGPVLAGMPYTVGEAGTETFVPSQSGYIVPHEQTSHALAAMSSVGAASGGSGSSFAEIHVHAHLDSKEVYTAVHQQELRWQTRNAGRRSGLSIPGNKIG